MRTCLLLVLLHIGLRGQAQTSWTLQPSGTERQLLDVQFVTNEVGYISGEKGTILKTTDGGNTWSNLTFDTTLYLQSLSFVTPESGYVAGEHHLYKTTDGGITWQLKTADTAHFFQTIKFLTEDLGFAGKEAYILKTTDGAASWDTVQYAPNGIKTIAFPSMSAGYFAGGNGPTQIFKTTDTGITFSGTPNIMMTIREELNFLNDTVGYLIGWYAPYIQKTVDGGATWHILDTLTYQGGVSVHFLNQQTGYVADLGTIRVTTDSGHSWSTDLTVFFASMDLLYGLKKITSTNTSLFCIGAAGKIYKKDLPLSVPALSTNNQVLLYPNPTNGVVTLTAPEGAAFKIFDVTGRIIKVGMLQKQQIQSGDLPAGNYIIQVQTGLNDVRSYRFTRK